MSTPAIAAARSGVRDFVELTKPRITLMVTLTALVGFLMASPAGPRPGPLLACLLGTTLVAAGASCLNMLLERRTDALMQRTRSRPLPAGRLRPVDALGFGLALTALGLGVLLWRTGPPTTAVALATWGSYLFLYTPLKTRTSLNTLMGAIPGALPPVIGWSAASNTLDPGAGVLFAILFLWQVPHFLAIAWIYREDYAQGGLHMLPVVDPDGRLTGRQAVAHSLGLLLVSLTPTLAGMAGTLYLAGAVLLGLALIAVSVRAAVERSIPAARRLFLASLVYLPALLCLLVFDRR